MSMKKETCIDCGRQLTKDEIALNKKLISLDLKAYRCLECLSVSFGCEVEDLKIKIMDLVLLDKGSSKRSKEIRILLQPEYALIYERLAGNEVL